MKNILLIGYGYWGRIILKNLTKLPEFADSKIHVYDKYIDITNLNGSAIADVEYINKLTKKFLATVDKAFVIVPSTQHFDTCKDLLENGVDVFCEKPLCSNSWQAQQLHDIAEEHGRILFTDWIFTYNDQINQIKKDYESGELGAIKSVRMKRLNKGPERFDVDARWDLASHDVSIVQYIFGRDEPNTVSWKNYKQNPESSQNDSTLGFIDYGDFKVFIDASWEFKEKNRECIFEFENRLVKWDDTKAELIYQHPGYAPIKPENPTSPLENSILAFLEMDKAAMDEQNHLTTTTLKILEK